MDWIYPAQDKDRSEWQCGNEHSRSIKCREFLEYLRTCQLLWKDSATWSQPVRYTIISLLRRWQSLSEVKKISLLLWNPKVNCHVHDNPLSKPILNQPDASACISLSSNATVTFHSCLGLLSGIVITQLPNIHTKVVFMSHLFHATLFAHIILLKQSINILFITRHIVWK